MGSQDLFRGTDAAIDVRLHLHDPLAVHPVDGGVSPCERGPGDAAERYFGAIGGADAHRFEIPQGVAFILGISHHDPNVLLAPLHPLGFVTVEGVAYLLTQVLQGQAEAACRRQQLQLHLLFAGPEGVADIPRTAVGLQRGAQFCRRRTQLLESLAIQLDIDGAAETECLRRKAQFDGVRDAAGELPPAVRELAGGRPGIVPGQVQLQSHFCDIALGGSAEIGAALGYGGTDTGEDMADLAGLAGRQPGVQLGPQPLCRGLDPGNRPSRRFHRGALRHGQGGVEMRPLH
jgi:hypothetical protein